MGKVPDGGRHFDDQNYDFSRNENTSFGQSQIHNLVNAGKYQGFFNKTMTFHPVPRTPKVRSPLGTF